MILLGKLPVRVLVATAGVHGCIWAAAPLCVVAQTSSGPATYLEVPRLSSDISEDRVTRNLTRVKLDRELFSHRGRQAVWARTTNDPADEEVYDFVTDPDWNRVVYSRVAGGTGVEAGSTLTPAHLLGRGPVR